MRKEAVSGSRLAVSQIARLRFRLQPSLHSGETRHVS